VENENKKADPSPEGEHTTSLLTGGGRLFLMNKRIFVEVMKNEKR